MANTLNASTLPPPPVPPKIRLSPTEGWATVILAAVVVLITIAAMQSLQWTSGLQILTWTAIVGMALGFVMAKQHIVAQWLAEIPAQLLGISFACYETASVAFNGNIHLLLTHLAIWLQAAFSGHSSNDDTIFLLFLAVLTMLLGYVSMWLIFRSRSPWLAVISNAIVLIISIVYASDDRLPYIILFLLAALLLLVRCNLVERMRVWRRKGLRYAPEIGWDFMQAGVIFTIVIMLVGALLPSNYVNTSLLNLWSGPNSPWSRIQNRFNQLFQVNTNVNSVNAIGFGSTLGISGNVNLPDVTVFSYTYTAPAGYQDVADSAYMLGGVYDFFDGQQWSQGKLATTTLPTEQVDPPGTTQAVQVTQSITTINSPNGANIYAIGQPGSFSMPTTAATDGVTISDSAQLPSYVDWQARPPLVNKQTYHATSYVSTATAAQLAAVAAPTSPQGDAQYSAEFLQRYTQLPADLTAPGNPNGILRKTALQWAATDVSGKPVPKDMYDQLESIVNHFGTSRFHYSQQNPNPNPSYDYAVALLQTGTGFCTWFATTMAMMARELGYPARIAGGFTHGDPATVAGKETTTSSSTTPYLISGKQAHAWVQVYFPGYGWINFEPSIAGGAFTEFTRATAPIANPGTNPQASPTPATTAVPTVKPPTGVTLPKTTIGSTSGFSAIASKIAISLSLLLALALLVFLGLTTWWRLIFRALSPISQTFRRMALLGNLVGIQPRPAQTASEYGELLSSRIPRHREAIEEITELYVRERWSPDAPSHASLTTRWNALRTDMLRHVPAALLARLRRIRTRKDQ